MTAQSGSAFLIVNADDYGYFHCVSKGILEAVSHGIVTATGVFATSVHFAEHVAWLREYDALDIGIHLNLTDGAPLTRDLRTKLASGQFPGKFSVAAAVLSGRIKTEVVKCEWRAQIERCLAAELSLRFINSHEHIHMLPPLFSIARDLAGEYDVPHVRFPTSDFGAGTPKGALFRGAVMKILEMSNRRSNAAPSAHFLGLEASGKLTLESLERCISQLRPGEVYELMCHPGRYDAQEVTDARLLRYHEWEAELHALTDPAVRDLLSSRGVRLIGYRHLNVRDGRLEAHRTWPEPT